MKKSIALMLVVSGLLPNLALAEKRVDVSVKGMVCSFCAQGIKKKFSSEAAVDKVDVSLENHRVSLSMKDDKDLNDEKIAQLLKDAGYTVEKISRENSDKPLAKK